MERKTSRPRGVSPDSARVSEWSPIAFLRALPSGIGVSLSVAAASFAIGSCRPEGGADSVGDELAPIAGEDSRAERGGAATIGIAEAKSFFADFVRLERSFDPAVADLYFDEATIRNRRIYPWDRERVVTIPAPMFKTMLRTAMPLTKSRGDTSTYSDVTFTVEGEGVRIDAVRSRR